MLSLSLTRRVFTVLISALFIALLFEPGQYSQAQTGNTIATVSAAHYEAPVAPDSIASLFGTNLATATASGMTRPLPTTLEGTTVTVEDSLGFQRTAGLYFVSPGQLNILIPADTATGPATLKVVAGNGAMSTGTVTIVQASPSIFAANSDGKGVPAADLIRVKPGNVQILEALIQGSYPNFVPRPIDMGPETDLMFLILYLTGLRGVPSTDGIAGNGSAENVRVILGGVEITPSYAGIAPGFFGLDQAKRPDPAFPDRERKGKRFGDRARFWHLKRGGNRHCIAWRRAASPGHRHKRALQSACTGSVGAQWNESPACPG